MMLLSQLTGSLKSLPGGRVVGLGINHPCIWDRDGQCERELIGHDEVSFCCVQCPPNKTHILMLLPDIDVGRQEATCVAVLEDLDGRWWVITGSADATLRKWATSDGTCALIFKGHAQVSEWMRGT